MYSEQMQRNISEKVWENIGAKYPKLGNLTEVLYICLENFEPLIHSKDKDTQQPSAREKFCYMLSYNELFLKLFLGIVQLWPNRDGYITKQENSSKSYNFCG